MHARNNCPRLCFPRRAASFAGSFWCSLCSTISFYMTENDLSTQKVQPQQQSLPSRNLVTHCAAASDSSMFATLFLPYMLPSPPHLSARRTWISFGTRFTHCKSLLQGVLSRFERRLRPPSISALHVGICMSVRMCAFADTLCGFSSFSEPL